MSQLETDVERLNSLLRGELSAVETYGQCIEKISDASIVDQLRALQISHERRAEILSERVLALGGEPSIDSGVWGGIAKMIEGGATLFGDAAALSVLEEGEEHGLASYERALSRLSPAVRDFIVSTILPEQNRTQTVLSQLEERV